MRKILSLLSAVLLSLGLVAATSGTATAAPVKHTASMQSGLLQLGEALGLFTIEGFGGAIWDSSTGTLTSPVNDNPAKSQKVIHNGGLTLTKADGTSLTIKNIHWDMKCDVVTGVIDDMRVTLFTTSDTMDGTATLIVHPEGGEILRAFVALFGIPADGSEFGTITLN